jgi:hypothetical protein
MVAGAAAAPARPLLTPLFHALAVLKFELLQQPRNLRPLNFLTHDLLTSLGGIQCGIGCAMVSSSAHTDSLGGLVMIMFSAMACSSRQPMILTKLLAAIGVFAFDDSQARSRGGALCGRSRLPPIRCRRSGQPLVAGELEARWNKALTRVAEVEGKIAAHHVANRAPVTDLASLATLATDLKVVWTDPETDARLKKRIVRTVIQEVIADLDQETAEIVLIVHWMGGIHSEIRLPRRRRGQRSSTSADIIAAVRQLVLIANDKSLRRHPQPERIADRPWQSLDPRARHFAALASPHCRLQACRGRDRTLAQPQQSRAAAPGLAANAQIGG